jgi:RHS repeat-associated protein
VAIDRGAHLRRLDLSLGGDVNRIGQYFWGLRYIDDFIYRQEDRDLTNADPMTDPAEPDFDPAETGSWYALTDVQFSVIALMTPEARIAERVVYDPYGRGRHYFPADYNGDTLVNVPDLNSHFLSAWFADNLSADWTRDNDTDVPDIFSYQTDWFAHAGDVALAGQISWRYIPGTSAGPDNQIGYCGYVFNPETDDYTVRFRHYDPEIGRWIERDPAGYVDGLSVFEYVLSGPIGNVDPYGLRRCQGPETEDQYWCPSRLQDELDRLERRNPHHRVYSCGKGTNTERRQQALANYSSDFKALGDAIEKTLKHTACVAECMVADGQYEQEVIEAIVNGALSELPGPLQLELDLDKDGWDMLKTKINEEGFAKVIEQLGIKGADVVQRWGTDNILIGGARARECEATEKLGRAMRTAGQNTKLALSRHGPKIRELIKKASRRNVVAGAAVELTCAAIEAGRKCSEACDKKEGASKNK